MIKIMTIKMIMMKMKGKLMMGLSRAKDSSETTTLTWS